MLSYLDDPHEGVDYVQIAGSNGKGSTAVMLERVLRSAGLDVGLYTSPDLNDLRERIRITGRMIPKEGVRSFVEDIEPCVTRLRGEGDSPTYFEVLTVLALQHFGARDVDVAVLEVGIGGQYDATSVVDPVASAVTSVSLEHTDILGDTVETIALDKAQVAPAGKPLVTGADGAALDAIRTDTEVVTVGERDCDVVAREGEMISPVESSVSIDGPSWEARTNLPLIGQHQATNAGIAATLARQVADVDVSVIERGLRDAHWPGRFEVMSSDPLVVLDGAHNPAACGTLTDLVDRYAYDELHLVFGAMQEKDHEEMVAALPDSDAVHLCRPDVDRAASLDTLSEAFDQRASVTEQDGTVFEAVERALGAAGDDDCVLVTGSLYAVAEARDRWTRLQIPKRTDTLAAAESVLTDAHVPDEFADQVAKDTVSRTFKTRLRKEQAKRLKQTMESIGGTCLTSDIDAPSRHVSVVLSGTAAQYERLIEAIQRRQPGLAYVAEQLRGITEDSPGTERFPWDADTAIMGILNVTPDSFYDGGRYSRVESAVQRARDMVDAGADIVDVGGESTRPGADPITADEEMDRVVPVIERIAGLNVPISVDTRKAAVADAALDAGADVINDVSGLSDPDMRFVAADHDASVVLMHSLDAPVDPERSVSYEDVVEDVVRELGERVLLAEQAGLDRGQIIVDPGIGFGKSPDECFELVDRLEELRALNCPIMVGHSRKSMFERVECDLGDRLPPTLAVTTMAAERGADIVRVHDVAENATAVRTVRETNGK
jgi:dihydropteroate synthase